MSRSIATVGVMAALVAGAWWSLRAARPDDAEVRAPAVAGQFYPGDAAALRRAVDTLLAHARPAVPGDVVAVVSPHAGYPFSGSDCGRRACATEGPRPRGGGGARREPRGADGTGVRRLSRRVHGAGRTDDGRAGVPPAAAETVFRARPPDSVAARVQEHHVARHAGDRHGLRRGSSDPNCPFGAKEVGQGPLLPVMPALANAIYDAVGVRIDELPLTPDKVVKALALKAEGKLARVGPDHFPDVPYAEPFVVPPPWEGGDGNAVKEPGKPAGRPREVATP